MRAGVIPSGVSDPGPNQNDVLNDAIPKALFAARDRFRGLIIERIILLEALRIDARNRRDPQAALESISSVAHKIAGVAATLGFMNAGKLAEELERTYYDGADRNVPLDALWLDIEPTLIALMDELESLLDT